MYYMILYVSIYAHKPPASSWQAWNASNIAGLRPFSPSPATPHQSPRGPGGPGGRGWEMGMDQNLWNTLKYIEIPCLGGMNMMNIQIPAIFVRAEGDSMALDPVSGSTHPLEMCQSSGLRPSEVWRIASPTCTSSTDVSSSARVGSWRSEAATWNLSPALWLQDAGLLKSSTSRGEGLQKIPLGYTMDWVDG